MGWQLPKLQTCVAEHTLVHEPQWAGSVCSRTHWVPHLVKPAWH